MKAKLLLCVLFLTCLGAGNSQNDERPPPRYSSEKLPKTKFTCEGKFSGRYYADADTDCQMFHVCTKSNRRDVRDFKFLCPNGTVFDQEHQVCADYYQVVCHPDLNTNLMNPFFEILKITSKDNTARKELGSASPPHSNYFSQNNLGNDEFQVEEYNNNKLASSRNSLPFQTSQFNGKDDSFPAKSTPNPIPVTKKPTTIAPISHIREAQQSPVQTQRAITESSIFPKTTSRTDTFGAQQPKFSSQLYHMVSHEFDDPEERNGERIGVTFENTKTTPASSTNQRDGTRSDKLKTTSIFDDSAFRFSDFASLSKFQTQFHKSLANGEKTKVPKTSAEDYETTASYPTSDSNEELNSFEFTETFGTTESTTIPANRPSFFFNYQTQAPRPRNGASITQRTEDFDFTTNSRTQTAPPDETSPRRSYFQNSFQNIYLDATTPQTFRQQPTRFNDEFFSKIDNLPKSHFSKNDDEDDYYVNLISISPRSTAVTRNEFVRDNFFEKIDTPLTSTTLRIPNPTTPTTTARTQQRRRPKQNFETRRLFLNQGQPTSIVVRNRNKTTTSTTSTTEKPGNLEILNTEASLNFRSARLNNLRKKPVSSFPETEVLLDDVGRVNISTTTTTTPHSPVAYSSDRSTAASKDETSQVTDVPEKRLKKLRGKKRFRSQQTSLSTTPATTTSTVKIDRLSVTTYRPAFPINPSTLSTRSRTTTRTLLSSTSTEEPELVTASPNQIRRLKSRLAFNRSKTRNSETTVLPARASFSLQSESPSPSVSPT